MTKAQAAYARVRKTIWTVFVTEPIKGLFNEKDRLTFFLVEDSDLGYGVAFGSPNPERNGFVACASPEDAKRLIGILGEISSRLQLKIELFNEYQKDVK